MSAPRRTPSAAAVPYSLVAGIAGLCLVVQVWLVATGGGDGTAARRLLELASYFTIQSTVLVTVTSVLLARSMSRPSPGFRAVHLDALVGITVTGLVYTVVLADDNSPTGVAAVVDKGLHYVVPALTILTWLAFGPTLVLDAAVIARALIWPLAWLAYTFAHGAITGWYPYPFLDVAHLGAGTAAVNVGWVLVTGVVVAAVLWALGRATESVRTRVRRAAAG
ncbi:Pr6Pr family membrane protein [Rhodococcus rhodnii]|uniref:Pr6Pr family membrane protein n=1 Tax=Rhodococcus rhodnii TaxID=38312 RepID=UPI000592C898|nr:Pr6Pr family membrane protein [Rhodococcus rhodnii]